MFPSDYSDLEFDFERTKAAPSTTEPEFTGDSIISTSSLWTQLAEGTLPDLPVIYEPAASTFDLLGPQPLETLPTSEDLASEDLDSVDTLSFGFANPHERDGSSQTHTHATSATTNVRKRRASADGHDQNAAPSHVETTKRRKLGPKDSSRLADNWSFEPSSSTSTPAPAAPDSTTTVADDAQGPAGRHIPIGTRGKLRTQCITPPVFVWDTTGLQAICMYNGPGRLHKDGRACDPLQLDGKAHSDRLSRHWLSHQVVEARSIAARTYGFDEAHIVKDEAQLQRAFANMMRCPRCRCSCQKAGQHCQDTSHGVHFTRNEKLQEHLASNKCDV